MKKLFLILGLLCATSTAFTQQTVYPYFPPPGITYSNGNLNTGVTATGSSTVRNLSDRFAELINVKDYGAKGNVLSTTNCSITNGLKTLVCPSATFSASDVGKAIAITGAAGSLNTLTTTISAFTNSTTVTVTAAASATTPITYGQGVPTEAAYGTGYAPNDTITLTGGSFTSATVLFVRGTKVVTITINAAGTGASNGTCTIYGATGTGAKFNASVTIVGNALSSIGVISGGYYTTNPTLTGEKVTSNCGLTNATVNLTMGVNVMGITTPGVYSVAPANPVAQGSTSGGGSGATFNMSYLTTGAVTYGTDDTGAFNAAIASINATYASGSASRGCISVPVGTSWVTPPLTRFAQLVPGCVLGGASGSDFKSIIYISPAGSGDVFSWSEAWFLGDYPFNGITVPVSTQHVGPTVLSLTFMGDRTAASDVTVLHFYDRNDFIFVDRVDVVDVKGQFIKTGDQLNQSQAFIRESYFGVLRCFQCGDTGLAAIEFYASGSGTGGTPVDIDNLNIYASYGDGLYIHNDATGGALRGYDFKHLRIEGLENNSAGISGHLLHIGNSAATGTLNGIHVFDSQLLGPYFGSYALFVDGGSGASVPYDIHVETAIAGGTSEGGGIDINSCRWCYFRVGNMATVSTNLTVASSATVGAPIVIDGGGMEATWTTNIDATAAASISMPVRTPLPLKNAVPYLLSQSSLKFILLPNGFMANNGVFVLGQAPSSSATLSVSATSGSVTATFSAATLLGTAADVGRVVTILDTTYKYCTITVQSSTTVATCTVSGGTLSGTGPFANANLWLSGSPTTNTTAFSVPLLAVYPNAYCYFPAGAIVTASSAGWYFCQMNSSTQGTVFNNTYSSGNPSIPVNPTAFSTTGPGAYTQSGSLLVGPSISLPANSLGLNGAVNANWMTTLNNSAGTKTNALYFTGNLIVSGGATSGNPQNIANAFVQNDNITNKQTGGGTIVLANNTVVQQLVRPTVDTTNAQTLDFRLQAATAATDWIVLERYSLMVQPN